MTGLPLRVLEVKLYERQVHLRLPFRFGVVTLREAPQAFVRVRVRLVDGREAWGMAAELMVPKWFDKHPESSNEANIAQLRLALHRAARTYLETEDAGNAFQFSETHYETLVRRCGSDQNSLSAQFGPAQMDKAILDGLCRAAGVSFPEALRRNLPGLRAGPLTPDLATFDVPSFLAQSALPPSIQARHTVGMLDALTDGDLAGADAPADGLPVTLEQVIRVYGNSCFKLKLSGDRNGDMERLRGIAAVLDTASQAYTVTLDGNEQFVDAAEALALWRAVEADPRLRRLCRSTLFIEQPIHRSVALSASVETLSRHVPVIIDESDATVEAFLEASALGYAGVSSKACKGLYKSILNAARCALWNRQCGEAKYLISGEDLTCQPGLAVQQDLALVGVLGITHVERNGHHYVYGMEGAPQREQAAFLAGHPDLYRDVGGRTCLRVEDGRINLESLDADGFASVVEPDWESLSAMSISDGKERE